MNNTTAIIANITVTDIANENLRSFFKFTVRSTDDMQYMCKRFIREYVCNVIAQQRYNAIYEHFDNFDVYMKDCVKFAQLYAMTFACKQTFDVFVAVKLINEISDLKFH